jgi:hypothetical protein
MQVRLSGSWTRAAVRAAVSILSLAAARTAPAGDSGTLDYEIRNRATVSAAFSAPRELDTLRLRMPETAEMRVTVAGTGQVRPDVRLLGPDDAPIDLTGHVRGSGRTLKIVSLRPGVAGLFRVDVRAAGTATGKYTLDASWKLPARETFSGTTADEGAFYAFDAEAGTVVDVSLRAADPDATIRVVDVAGPQGYLLAYDPPVRPSTRTRIRIPALPVTGRYRVSLVTDRGGREISGVLARRAPTKRWRVNLRGAERQGAGVARTVTRIVDSDGADVDVPRLEQEQRVSIDSSGVCLSVPAGGIPFPAVFQVRSDEDAIDDPLGFAPAGSSVHFDAGDATFEAPVGITLPYDVGAFAAGDVLSDICILRRADDGTVYEIPRSSAVVDVDAGTVTFPTSTFSSYQVFSPPQELVEIAQTGKPNDMAVAPDEDVLYYSTDVLSSENPASALLRYVPGGVPELFAGGGTLTGDGVHRLDYDFDRDMGFQGVFLSAVAVAAGGEILLVTGDLDRTRSVVYEVLPDDTVVRIAGDGTADLDESKPARETGLPFCCAAAFHPQGGALVVTDAYLYPESDRVLGIYATGTTTDTLRIGTVAGGGTADVSGFAPLETRLLQPRAVIVDAQNRILVGDRDWLVRFDLDADTTTTVAGTNFGETEAGVGRVIGGVGAPLRTVVLGALDDLAFAPGREDILYAADPEAGIVWRLDLVRDRAFIAAGRRVDFTTAITTREPTPQGADPDQVLNFPVAVAPLGGEVFIAERFDDRLFSLRRKE